jgi:hypothetical protein
MWHDLSSPPVESRPQFLRFARLLRKRPREEILHRLYSSGCACGSSSPIPEESLVVVSRMTGKLFWEALLGFIPSQITRGEFPSSCNVHLRTVDVPSVNSKVYQVSPVWYSRLLILPAITVQYTVTNGSTHSLLHYLLLPCQIPMDNVGKTLRLSYVWGWPTDSRSRRRPPGAQRKSVMLYREAHQSNALLKRDSQTACLTPICQQNIKT